MSRALVSLSGLALCLTSACGVEQEDHHPDVLFLLVDTLRADRLGCYGYERPTSPVIDELAAGGAVMTRTSSQAPWTPPSMSSMITSRYFTAHRDVPEAEAPTLAESFQTGGYHTIGVVGNGLLKAEHGFARGFDKYMLAPPGTMLTFPDLLDLLREPLDAALKGEERAPLFLYFHATDPHAPYIPHPKYDKDLPLNGAPAIGPQGWQERRLKALGPDPPAHDPGWERELAKLDRQRARYDQEVRFTDEHVGVLLEMLEERGVSDDLLVVLVSDHGEGLWEQVDPSPAQSLIKMPPKQFFFGSHQHDLSEQALRTPFILSGPGVPRGARFDEPVENVDLFPTLLSLCDLPRPGDLHGLDLTQLFDGGVGDGDWREESYAFVEQFVCIRDETAQLKLVVPTAYGIEKGMRGPTLYHLDQDPSERRDISSQRPGDVSRLRARLEAHLERYPTTIDRIEDHTPPKELEALGYGGARDQPAASDPEGPNTMVFVTKTRTKYHRDGCRSLSKSKVPLKLSAARVLYSPCSNCKPPN